MKKDYTAPVATICSVVSAEIIAASVPVGSDVENGIAGAKKRKREWGNLWEK